MTNNQKFGYQTLMNLPRHLFFVSTPCHGNREYQVLQTIDHQTGPSKPEDVIKHSLKEYGKEVDVEELMGQIKDKSLQRDFLDWPISPAEWVILLSVRLFGGSIDEEALRTHLMYDPTKPKPYVLNELGFVNALKNLTIDNAKRGAWLTFKDETIRQLREEAYAYGKKELKAQDIHTRLWRLDLSDKRAKRLLDVTFRGEKAGGVEHIYTIMAQRKIYWLNGWIVRVDNGETDESVADLYVTPILPASRTEGAKGYIDHVHWDYPRSFAVEVECYPARHWDRLENNYLRNKKMGFPTVFIVPNKADAKQLKDKLLLDWKATYVANSASFEPDHPEQVAIEIAKTLDSKNNPELNPTNTTDQTTQPLEQQTQKQATENNAPQKTLENKVDPSGVKVLAGEVLVCELAEQNWQFRIKTVKDKLYLCAKKDAKERYIGAFNEDLKHIVEKNKIDVKYYSNTKTPETPSSTDNASH
ncbi:MAG: hypothetical protein LBQ98_01575 [Nitrososphaerota archaeon]|nr:hypothetical protein [Nitrososphaerota archaeon]